MIELIAIIILGICFGVLVWHKLQLGIKEKESRRSKNIMQHAKDMFPEIDNPIEALDKLYQYYHRAALVAKRNNNILWESFWALCLAIKEERAKQLNESVSFEIKCLNIMRPPIHKSIIKNPKSGVNYEGHKNRN